VSAGATDRAISSSYGCLLGVDTATDVPHRVAEFLPVETLTGGQVPLTSKVGAQKVVVAEHVDRVAHGVVVVDPHQDGGPMSVLGDLYSLVGGTGLVHEFRQLGSGICEWQRHHVQNSSVEFCPSRIESAGLELWDNASGGVRRRHGGFLHQFAARVRR